MLYCSLFYNLKNYSSVYSVVQIYEYVKYWESGRQFAFFPNFLSALSFGGDEAGRGIHLAYRFSDAETIFGQGGQDREHKSQEREVKVFARIRAFFIPKRSIEASSCPEMKRSPKNKKKIKRSTPDSERLLVLK